MMLRCLCLLCVLLAVPGAGASEIAAWQGTVGREFPYTVRRGDTLTSISARFGVSEQVLIRTNRLPAPNRLKAGNRLVIRNVHLVPGELHDGVLINLPQRMLFLFREAKVAAAYPVALGRRDWQTPTGDFFVVQRERNKTWIVPPSIQEEMQRSGKPVLTRVPPGPDNPLGEYWMGLSIAGYGIHSTNAPASIYRIRTHGCIRLHPDDAAALYEQVEQGTTVKIVYAPVLLAAPPDRPVLVEVNPDVYNRGVDALKTLREMAQAQGIEAFVDWTIAGRIAAAKEGVAREAGYSIRGREAGTNGRRIIGNEPQPTPVHALERIASARGACIPDGAR